MVTQVVFLTSGSTWTVPSDFNFSNNTIEAIGGGGGSGSAWPSGGAGGGGGAYTKLSNFYLTPGQVVNINIGTGAATPTSNGGDTWLNTAAASAPSSSATGVLAKGGSYSANTTGGLGGQAAACIPSASAFSGGNGGTGGVNGGGGGGGGAAGPNGDGGTGGPSNNGTGGGGGGANGGTNGTASVGGTGGGSPTGAAGSGVQSPGGTGAGGGGGGGGAGGSNYRGGEGGVGVYWTATSTTSQTATISIANPGIFTVATAPQSGTQVVFSTTGALPTGITAGTTYYVVAIFSGGVTSTTTFSISATLNGTAINTTGTQSGTHTATFTAVAGPGGGSGAGTSTSGPPTTTGSGGNYGGGQGNQNGDTSGSAGQGIIVVTYTTPIYATRLTSSGNLYTSGTLDEVSLGVGSINFNGTTQYLTVPSNAGFALGTGDFTIEGWFYCLNVTSTNRILGTNTNNNDTGFNLDIATNQLEFGGWTTTTKLTAAQTAALLNTWAHIAWVRNSGVETLYINGVSTATATRSLNFTTTNLYIGVTGSGNLGFPFSGYISNLRISNNSVYNAAFTPSQSLLPATANTKLLLNVLNSSSFINDSSANKFTLTNVGSATWTATGPFNGGLTSLKQRQINDGTLQVASTFDEVTNNPAALGSLQFDGTSGYLTIPYNSYFNFNSGSSVSFEAWVYPTSYTNPIFLASRNWSYGGTGPTWGFRVSSATSIDWAIAGTGSSTYILLANTTLSGASTVPLNSWSHVAFTRDTSGNAKIFVNGYLVAARADSQTLASASGSVYIGIPSSGGNYSQGYISNLRLVSNSIPVAYQTSNTTTGSQIFTPPIQPPNAIANTQLLINPPNTSVNNILDTSTNAATITKNGTVTSSPQTPLTLDGFYNYSFNGTTDYLTIPTNTNYNLGSNDFTVEGYIYPSSVTGTHLVIERRTSGGFVAGNWGLYMIGANLIFFSYEYNSAGNAVLTSGTLAINTWYHFALVRNGASIALYINGTSAASTTAVTIATGTVGLTIGADVGSGIRWYWSGYISNLRIVNGTAVYTGTFIPPSEPLTAIANTKLLTCKSNKIVDSSSIGAAITITGTPSVNSNTSPFTTYNYAGSGVAVQRLSSTGSSQISGIFDEVTKPT